MKQIWNAFSMCQSMFCAIPWPFSVWDEKSKDNMLLFLPVIGLEIGFLWAGLGWLMEYWGLSNLVVGAALCIFPFLSTGCIHLDGFMDVTDAVKSCRSLEKRREILKDSHVGAFAVIGCVLLMLLQFAFCTEISGNYEGLVVIPVVSRCCSALAVALLKPMSTSQYSGQKITKYKIMIPLILIGVTIAGGYLLLEKAVPAIIGVIAGYAFSLRKAYCSMEGMNGDISGYALTIGELCGIAVLAVW